MAENKLLIGRIPVNKGVYASEKTYNKLSYCSYCGSTYMSLVDGNTSAPCIFNEETQRYEHANTDVWQCIADGLDAYNAGNDIQTLSASTTIFDENGIAVSANPMSFISNVEFAFAMVDSEDKLLFGIRNDGSVYQCAVDGLTQAQIDASKTAAFDTINSFSAEISETIAQLSGQTSIFDDNGIAVSANPMSFTSNAEFVTATIDADGKLLYGIRKDGSVYQCAVDDLTQARINEIVNAIGLDAQEKFDILSGKTDDITNTLEGFSADTLSSLDELDYAVFPIGLKMTVNANSDVTSNNIEYHIKRKGVTFVPDNITIQRQVGSYGALVQIYSGSTADGTTTATISGNVEGFIAEAVKGNKSKTVTDVKYICYFGANANETVASVEDFSGLTKVQTTSINVTRTIQTNSDEFIWIIVPNVLFINRVTSSGFDVSLNEPVNVTTTLGTFKAYRSKNALDSASWTLKIEGTSNFEFSNKDYTQYYEPTTTEENPEYKKVVLDSEDKILWSINVEDEVYSPDLSEYEVEDGTKVSNIVNYITSNPPYSV